MWSRKKNINKEINGTNLTIIKPLRKRKCHTKRKENEGSI